MTNDDDLDLDLDHELSELRRLADKAGVTAYLASQGEPVELESPDDLIARLKSSPPTHTTIDLDSLDETLRFVTPRRTRRIRTLIAGTAAAVVVGIVIGVQPWGTQIARAATPPLLDFEFAQAQRIADANGVDPIEALEELARTAESHGPRVSASDTQHVITEGWAIDADFDPDPNSTITPTSVENWLYPDGRFRTRAYYGDPLTADGRGVPIGGTLDREVDFFAQEVESPGSRDPHLLLGSTMTVESIREILLDRIDCLERTPGQERTLCLFEEVKNLPRTHVIPGSTMANIWRMLAEEDGLRSLGEVTDRTGRKAIALSFIWVGAPEIRFVILADIETGQVIGSEDILIKSAESLPVQPPAIRSFTAIVKAESQP